ncbi:MAG: putative DNA binding domain-containing protein [Rhodocyclaceae bacterium]|nr:putative DNA binding domain-containing protein [Rhodocyclaceae bacterium]
MTNLTGPTAERLAELIVVRRESATFETKRVSGKMVGKALETVCAFANTEGGILVLGVEDYDKAKGRGRLIGIGENPEAVDELRRKLATQFHPPIEDIDITTATVALGSDEPGQIVMLRVPQSAKVHSIVDDGTWTRLSSSNRQVSAAEITELSFRRGITTAESEAVEIPLSLLETDHWAAYCTARGLVMGDTASRLLRIGLARQVGEQVWPTKAAVLLFADFPSDLLAAHGSRAAVRVFHHLGNAIGHGPDPNLRKAPKTIGGPVVALINATLEYLKNEIAGGFRMAASGFETTHIYPERVIKEAITNAVLHRDYRYPRDVLIRIFDNRIEIDSPGEFPANITPATIATARSAPRNPSLVGGAREFPNPPNVDAGEGVPMMFATMRAQGLYPPQYMVNRDSAIPSVTVALLNEHRPAIWEQVADWIDRHGHIANRDLRRIAGAETLEATRMLKGWVDHGLLLMDESRGKRGTVYRKPARQPDGELSLFSDAVENKNVRA